MSTHTRLAMTALLISALALSACDDNSPSGGGGKPNVVTAPSTSIAFERTVYDFGRVMDVGTYTTSVPFTNTGANDLIIGSVKADCACVTAAANPEVVAPGEQGAIEITLKPVDMLGDQRVQLTIVTNTDPAIRSLAIGAIIEPVVILFPPVVTMRDVALHETHRAVVQVASRDGDMTIESIRSSNEHISARMLDHEEARALGLAGPPEGFSRSIAEVTMAPSHPWGEVSASILLQTRVRLTPEEEPIEHSLAIQVVGTVYGDIKASRQMLNVGAVNRSAPYSTSVELRRPSGESFQILSAQLELNIAGEVTYERIEDGGAPGYLLTLSGVAPNVSGRIEGVVSVVTDIHTEGLLQLRVTGSVRRP